MPGHGKKPESPRAPGWYPDPWSATGTGERYFDGKRWGTSERPRARHSPPPTTNVLPLRRPGRLRRVLPRRRPGRLRRARPLIGLVVLVALAVAIVKFGPHSGSDTPSAATFLGSQVPPASTEESAHALGTPAPVPAGPGGFEFLQHQPRDVEVPVAFDPCRPVHYVVNPAGEPADGQQLVADAITTLHQATGLRFVADGSTTEAPSKQRLAYQPDRYDKSRWAPVLISWQDEQSYPSLAGYIAGIAGPRPWSTSSGQLAYVTGQVVLDRVQLDPAQLPDRSMARAIILHELGHLVGLDHTADRTQIMYSEAEFNVADYGAGDRRGLALLGTQPCVPEL
jgi:hypothetical protein